MEIPTKHPPNRESLSSEVPVQGDYPRDEPHPHDAELADIPQNRTNCPQHTLGHAHLTRSLERVLIKVDVSSNAGHYLQQLPMMASPRLRKPGAAVVQDVNGFGMAAPD